MADNKIFHFFASHACRIFALYKVLFYSTAKRVAMKKRVSIFLHAHDSPQKITPRIPTFFPSKKNTPPGVRRQALGALISAGVFFSLLSLFSVSLFLLGNGRRNAPFRM